VIKTKKSFRLYGDIWWHSKNDKRTYSLFIDKSESLYKKARSRGIAQLLFKKELMDYLRKQFPQNHPSRFADIILCGAKFKEIKERQRKKTNQLFKRIKKGFS